MLGWSNSKIMQEINQHQQALLETIKRKEYSGELFNKLYWKFLELECMQSDAALRQFVKEKCPNLDFIQHRLPNARSVRDRASLFLALLVDKRHVDHGLALGIFVEYLLELGLLNADELL